MIYTMNSCIILLGYKSAAHVLPRHENTAKHMDRMIIEELPTPEVSCAKNGPWLAHGRALLSP